ncbi:hypothetical protein TNCV_3757951 [Trichonephila clavipes]|nr:hypothetical protein TNCV_3757951 [Trichonephila clavipes]
MALTFGDGMPANAIDSVHRSVLSTHRGVRTLSEGRKGKNQIVTVANSWLALSNRSGYQREFCGTTDFQVKRGKDNPPDKDLSELD